MIWLLVSSLAFMFVVVGAWGVKNRRRRVMERSEPHDLLVLALEDWLAQDSIRQAMYAARITDPRHLARFRNDLGKLSHVRLQQVTGALLRPRQVRMMVAKHMKKRGVEHAEAMRQLKMMSEVRE
jgi:hypothetical protein